MSRNEVAFVEKSQVENDLRIKTYNDLLTELEKVQRTYEKYPNLDADEDKGYSTITSRSIWITVVKSTKPLTTKTYAEEQAIAAIYKIIFSFTKSGEYPLMQQLANYLGVGLDEFYLILRDITHPLREPYMWAHNVFESAAQFNAVRNNGNANARQWIDKSREGKMAAEDRVNLAIEAQKIDKLKEIGADIAMEMIGDGEE